MRYNTPAIACTCKPTITADGQSYQHESTCAIPRGEYNPLCVTLHTEGNTVYAIADNGEIWGSSNGRNSCLYETACRTKLAGYSHLRFDGGDSVAVDELLTKYDPFATPSRRR